MSEQQPQTIAAYLRVSTAEQSTDAQIDAIHAAGIDPVRVFAEHRSGAAGSERPEWEACLGWLRPGDVLVVAALDRVGRSVREVSAAVADLHERGIVLRSLRESIDTATSAGRMVVGVMASVAELELELGRERRAASRAARIARGLPATRPHKLGDADQRRLVRLRSQGEPISELSSIFGVSAATVYRVLSRHREAATSAA